MSIYFQSSSPFLLFSFFLLPLKKEERKEIEIGKKEREKKKKRKRERQKKKKERKERIKERKKKYLQKTLPFFGSK